MPGIGARCPLRWRRTGVRRGSAGWCTRAARVVLAVRGLALLAAVGVAVVGHRRRRRWSRRDGPGRGCGCGRRKEGTLCLHAVEVLDAMLFLQEVGLGVEEGWGRVHGGEDDDRLAELVVQSAQSVDDEGGVGDGGAAVVKRVGEALEFAAVRGDVHVALKQTMEFLLGVHRALKTVVEELAGDGDPDGVGIEQWKMPPPNVVGYAIFFKNSISSSTTVYLSENPIHHRRTKHIELDIHFVREKVALSQFKVLHVPTRYQFADIMTKGLPAPLFTEFRNGLCIRSI